MVVFEAAIVLDCAVVQALGKALPDTGVTLQSMLHLMLCVLLTA